MEGQGVDGIEADDEFLRHTFAKRAELS